MKRLLLLLFISVYSVTYSQEIVVLNNVTYQPIAGVVIYNETQAKNIITDLDGKANLSIFEPSDVLFFRHLSYQLLKTTKDNILQSSNRILLHPDTQSLSEIVVSASKFVQKRTEIPQKIASLNQQKIQLSNPQTSADLLSKSGNVFIQKSQVSMPNLRG